jgi:preprotein translocase subunit SecA
MEKLGLDENEPIQSSFLNTSLETAQKKVEAYYSDIRKQLFNYDEALTLQRNGVYAERKRIIENENLRDWVIEYGERSLYDIKLSQEYSEYYDSSVYANQVQELLGFGYNSYIDGNNSNDLPDLEFLKLQFQISYDLKELQLETIEPGLMRELEKSFLLQQIDYGWKENLKLMSYLRDSIRWRAYAQKDPLADYKQSSYDNFISMLKRVRHRVTYFILRSKILLDF